jgi:cephalosporin hydroxylase
MMAVGAVKAPSSDWRDHFRMTFEIPEVEAFHELYRNQGPSQGPPWARWFGYVTLKCPMDLWVYQELIWNLRPMWIVEGGTGSGGSALFMATVLDRLGYGGILSIDLGPSEECAKHDRITYLQGDTLTDATWLKVAQIMQCVGPRMIVLDDGHAAEHVYTELKLCTALLRPGDVLIVEDTNLGGPLWGLDQFLSENPGRFERDRDCERFLMTFNPGGYLRCVA